MAATIKRYTGLAPVVAQVDTFTPGGTIEIGDIFTLTITGLDGSRERISFAATAATAANVAAGLVAAWNAATGTLMSAITASGTVTVVLTADVPGDAFSVVGTTTEANGDAADDQTFTRAATVANSGPKDISIVTNWQDDALPGAVTEQTVWIEGQIIAYGLDALASISNAIDVLNIARCQGGANPAAGTGVIFLQVKATVVNIEEWTGPGSSSPKVPFNIDTGSVASTINVYNTTSNSPSTAPAVRIKVNNAAAVVNIHKGIVGIGFEPSEVAVAATVNVSYVGNVTGDAEVYIGSGVTLATLNITGGDTSIKNVPTTINHTAGYLTKNGIKYTAIAAA